MKSKLFESNKTGHLTTESKINNPYVITDSKKFLLDDKILVLILKYAKNKNIRRKMTKFGVKKYV